MQAFHACATRRCRSQARDLLSQPLWRCQKNFLRTNEMEFIKAAPKRLRQQVSPKAKQRRAARRGRISVISVFFSSPRSQSQKPYSTKKERELLPPPAKELRHNKVRTAHSMSQSCPADRHAVAPDSLCNPGERTFLRKKRRESLLITKLRNVLPRPH